MTERKNSTYVVMTQAELDAGAGNNLSADRIVIVDAANVPTGVTYDSGPAGQAPTVPVTAGNINTVLQSAGGAGWEKAQATAANYAITRPASGAGLDLHIESGGTLDDLTAANWPVPASGVDQLRIRNFSGSAKTLTAGAGWNMVTADGNPLTSGSYSIPDDRAVEVTLDPQGFAQVVPWGGEVTQAEFTAGLAGKSATSHAHTKADIGLGSVDNTADSAKPVSTAQQTALNLKQDASTAATDAELAAHTGSTSNPHGVTASQVGLGSVTNTSDANKPVSTATQTALDAKQATLVSGTNLRSVNGSSLLGAGNVAVAADLPGGTAMTVTNEGLVTTGSPSVDTATVPGETIIRWTGAGNFTVPIGVTNVRVLAVAGGGGGGNATGGGGGAGGKREVAALAVTPGVSYSVTVGAGGASHTDGLPSSVGSLITTVGGGRGGNAGAANIGGSGGGGGGAVNAPGGAGTSNEGNAGGAANGWVGPYRGGGGGGAGAVGTTATNAVLGNGGAGSSSDITGSAVFYAGGGGGGTFAESGSNFGTGGTGGGGNGSINGNGVAGTANTGGGGGGAGNNAGNGGAGGSGVVIIRFATQTRSYQALTSYADNAAAIAAGKLVGEFWRKTSDGSVQQVT